MKEFTLICGFLFITYLSESKITRNQRSSGIRCNLGYHGPNCTTACRFPNYGFHCQSECHCAEEICNIANGCPGTGVMSTAIDKRLFRKVSTANIYNLTREIHGTADISLKTQSQNHFITESDATATKLNLKESAKLGTHTCADKNRKKPFDVSAINLSLVFLTTISGVFLILYIGLYVYMIKIKPLIRSPAACTV